VGSAPAPSDPEHNKVMEFLDGFSTEDDAGSTV